MLADEPDPAVFQPARAGAFRSRVALPDEACVVGSFGPIDPSQGLETLLDAVPVLEASRPGVRIVIAGPVVPGKERYAAGLQRRAVSLPGVCWLGARDDVPDLLADLDVLVVPSAPPQPFDLLPKALASGVPVIAGRVAGDAAALAAAVARLLPASSGTAERGGRRPLGKGEPPDYAAVFDQVLEGSA